MDLKRIREKKVPFDVQYQGETVRGECYPGRMTGSKAAAIMGASMGETPGVVSEILPDVIACWDVTCGGEPYPPTPENLLELPVELLTAVAGAIVGGGSPNTKSSSS
ncbi:MAG TPA: hypothetical protein DCQ64_24070 [Candidatus Rokubacteria bacterium]|nr:hypothetical protein [Candidatus Rokubacteria bacterium]